MILAPPPFFVLFITENHQLYYGEKILFHFAFQDTFTRLDFFCISVNRQIEYISPVLYQVSLKMYLVPICSLECRKYNFHKSLVLPRILSTISLSQQRSSFYSLTKKSLPYLIQIKVEVKLNSIFYRKFSENMISSGVFFFTFSQQWL